MLLKTKEIRIIFDRRGTNLYTSVKLVEIKQSPLGKLVLYIDSKSNGEVYKRGSYSLSCGFTSLEEPFFKLFGVFSTPWSLLRTRIFIVRKLPNVPHY